MLKRTIAALIAITVIMLYQGEGFGADVVNPTRLTITPSCASVGSTVTIRVSANKSSGVYFRYVVGAPGGATTLLKDWTTDTTATWTPTSNGVKTVTVWVTDDYLAETTGQIYSTYEVGASNCEDPLAISLDQGNGHVNEPVTINARGARSGLYYQFAVASGYPNIGTWETIQDWSTSGSCEWTPTSNNWYGLGVAIDDGASINDQGQALLTYKVGPFEDPSSGVQTIHVTRVIADILTTPQAGDTVTFTATAIGPTGTIIHYKFLCKAGYGTTEWNNNPWITTRDWSENTFADILFPAADNYVVIVQAKAAGTTWTAGDAQGGVGIIVFEQ